MKKIGRKLVFLFPNLFKLLFRRVVLVSLSILIQFLVLFIALRQFSSHYAWVYVFFSVLSVVVVLVLINSRTHPAYQIAWLIPITVFPVFGAVLYLILGGGRLSPRLVRRMEQFTRQMKAMPPQPEATQALRELDPVAARQSAYLTSFGGGPVYQGTQTTYYPTAEACFISILDELEKAKNYIYLEYFIIAEGTMWDQILAILREKKAQGLDVRVIYDDFGSINRLPSRYYRQLEAEGIACAVFNPYIPIMSSRLNNRDHRKLLIIDGAIAFTGGTNLADEYINELPRFGHWKDNGILVRGEAAWSMTVMFLSMWCYLKGLQAQALTPPQFPPLESDGFVQPYADNPLDGEAVGETVYRNLIGSALDHIWIMTPYLILGNETLDSLTTAAKSGLDVRIITPGIPDKRMVHTVTRSYYDALLEAGVRIYEYTPGFVHSKVFAVDGIYATVGTVNLDFRSLYLHFENGLWLYRTGSISQVEADFLATLDQCQEITPESRKQISGLRRLAGAVLRVFAPLM